MVIYGYMVKTTIAIDKNTREELKLLGKKDEDYDEIIKKCITFTKIVENRLKLVATLKNVSYEKLLEEMVNAYENAIMKNTGYRKISKLMEESMKGSKGGKK
jgi:hypothetical protein